MTRVKDGQLYTTDQRLLGEIRDHLVALPLAKELKHQDVETAKKLRRELDDIDARVSKMIGLTTLLLRIQGVHPDKLNEDEIHLLADVEAIDAEKLEELLARV
jgi:metal-dependent amidase/aminoacylase/carboxypeptidase family protein